jgi:hypothetical protein
MRLVEVTGETSAETLMLHPRRAVGGGGAQKKPRIRRCAAQNEQGNEANYFFVSVFFSIVPEPPHFAQFLPSLAASTQHEWLQALPSALAVAQHLATLDSVLVSAANATLAARSEPTRNATIDWDDFFM